MPNLRGQRACPACTALKLQDQESTNLDQWSPRISARFFLRGRSSRSSNNGYLTVD